MKQKQNINKFIVYVDGFGEHIFYMFPDYNEHRDDVVEVISDEKSSVYDMITTFYLSKNDESDKEVVSLLRTNEVSKALEILKTY